MGMAGLALRARKPVATDTQRWVFEEGRLEWNDYLYPFLSGEKNVEDMNMEEAFRIRALYEGLSAMLLQFRGLRTRHPYRHNAARSQSFNLKEIIGHAAMMHEEERSGAPPGFANNDFGSRYLEELAKYKELERMDRPELPTVAQAQREWKKRLKKIENIRWGVKAHEEAVKERRKGKRGRRRR